MSKAIAALLLIQLLASVMLISRFAPELKRNVLLACLAVALSFVQARPEIQSLFGTIGPETGPYSAKGLPIFIVLYLIFGQFSQPSVAVAFAGSFLCLLVTDVSHSFFWSQIGPESFWFHAQGIGGAGLVDGLVIAPIAASAITYLVVILGQRGVVFRSMLGQRRYMESVGIDRHR
jgi:hypothetical protein